MASNFPAALDNFPTNHVFGEIIDEDTDNDQADALNKIEAELGINPSGPRATVGARISVIEEGPINVKNPPTGEPAKADGSDDAPEIQACIDLAEAASPPGSIYLPRGIYRTGSELSIASDGVCMFGDGPNNTLIQRLAVDFDMLRVGGPNAASHKKYNKLHDFQLHGNDRAGTLLRLMYADNQSLNRLRFWGNNGRGLDSCEWWDSLVDDCAFEWVGGIDGTKPAIHLRSSMTASGDGSSADSTNMIRITNCRLESWKDGGIWVENGPSGFGGNGIWIDRCKVESFEARGVAVKVGGTISEIHMENSYIYIGQFNAGYSTPINAIEWAPANMASMENVWVANGAVATIRAGVMFWGNAQSLVKGVRPAYGTNPTVAHLEYAGSQRPVVEGSGAGMGQIGTGHVGATPYGNYVANVASAATLLAPLGAEMLVVSGSTTVTNIGAGASGAIGGGYAGMEITLVWAAGATFDVTDGGNIKLSASITTFDADDTVTLKSDGTNWYEIGRSTN